MAERFIQKAIGSEKEGATRRMLGIPAGETIPFTFLEEIRVTPIGRRAKNPTKVGHRSVKVTRLLKQRATFNHRQRAGVLPVLGARHESRGTGSSERPERWR